MNVMPKKLRGHTRGIKIDNQYIPYIEWNLWYNHRWTQHRVGQPAVIWRVSGFCEWWIRGQRYFYTHNYCKECKMTKIKTMKMVLKYGNHLPLRVDQL